MRSYLPRRDKDRFDDISDEVLGAAASLCVVMLLLLLLLAIVGLWIRAPL